MMVVTEFVAELKLVLPTHLDSMNDINRLENVECSVYTRPVDIGKGAYYLVYGLGLFIIEHLEYGLTNLSVAMAIFFQIIF